jgi:phospholipid-translocating ATPase
MDIYGGKAVPVEASKLRVGDLVKINVNEAAPADLIIVHISEKTDSVFIRTDQLDGETDWKTRRPLTVTHKQILQYPADLNKFTEDEILCEQPN